MNSSYLVILFFLTSPLIYSQVDEENKAIRFYNDKIKIVESFHINGTSEQGHVEAIEFFEELTKIKACYEYDIAQQPWKLTTKHIINDWKIWLKLNQENIYWDEKLHLVLVTDDVEYIEKDPKKVFLKNLSILETNTYGDFIDLTEQRCAYDFFYKIIPNESTDLTFDEEEQMVHPSKSYFTKLKDWFDKNKMKLIWDKKNQEVKTNQ